MGGCAAPNCSNQSKNNFRMFRFPRNEERRRKWIVNSRRDQWIPGPGAYLCEVHFEENQFECSRQDGRKKLKPNAVPTLFNVPNPPQLLTPQRLKGIGLPKHRSVTSNFCNGGLLHGLPLSTEAISVAEPSVVHLPQPSASYFGEINFAAEVSDVCLQEQASTSSCDKMIKCHLFVKDLITEIQLHDLQVQHEELLKGVKTFLSDEQIAMLKIPRRSIAKWSNEGIIKGLKVRFDLPWASMVIITCTE
ncbi:peroxynitrite isomerase THAP4-like [Stegodyphus dumicola]|uniref:peroxynitrite isomerase THAP4-like n=1 Tax=Stegodyphus dumicola TaxID=202533 RepID=UPI0015A80E05|nr:peroxynitrite isomerase THAP4-like [Stegodyphus dumicola]